ncbi:zinc finger protein 317-like [Phlebotomus argentipes]|uniref:zinc finger protein 317-like n=1 Tax=Phlebotomus argentipes TaxID=94469 RepID=UPI0028933054|nr:zinc finger protein 317-like [Phlebotomus argentipes]
MIPFLNIYFELVGITPHEYSSFPALLCVACETEMVRAYQFREMCIETEDKLKSMLNDEAEDTKAIEFVVEDLENGQKLTVIASDMSQKMCKKWKDFQKKFPPERVKQLEKKTIQCKRCDCFYKGLDLFKVHKCFEESQEDFLTEELVSEIKIEPETCAPVVENVVIKPVKRKYRTKEERTQSKTVNKRIYKCDLCQMTFKHIQTYNRHKDRHENFHRYPCKYCDKKFDAWTPRRTHIYRKHLKTFFCFCDQCGKGFYTKYALRVHIQKDHLKVKFQCEVCGKTLVSKGSLLEHRSIHNSKKLSCKICGKQLNTRTTLNQHVKTHSGEKNYICPVCSRGFTCNHSLKVHVRKLHPDDVHLLPPDGTINNQKFLKMLAEKDE